jgi:acetyl esterase
MLAMEGPPAHEVPVDQARAGHEAETAHLSGPGEEVSEVRDLEIPSAAGAIPARLYRPQAGGPLPLVVYLHGGGWMLGSIESFDTVVRALANAADVAVLSVGYRLAPEAPFPAGLDDAVAAVRWAAAEAASLGADPERLAIAGDSAGGNLATVVARRLRGEVDLRMQVLIYPVTDAGCNTASYREFGERHGLTAASMQRFWNLYLDGADGLDPDASPLRSDDLAGSPPTFVLTAGFDVLRDEAEAYVAALRAAGVEAGHTRYGGAIHGFWRWLAVTGLARTAVEEVAGALRARLA